MQTLDLGGVELDARHGEPLADCESGALPMRSRNVLSGCWMT
jgi:hypothetical protein